MANVRIQLRSITPAVLCCAPMWCQTATLTGRVLDKRGDTPINGARVSVVGFSHVAVSNSEGKYSIAGLTRGSKVKVSYEADGYGILPSEVQLNKDLTEHTVHLYKNIIQAGYWIDVSREVQRNGGGKRSQVWLREEWKGVDGSTLSPEAKSSAAHAFAAALPPDARVFKPITFQDYSITDPDAIAKAKEDFQKAIVGQGRLVWERPRVPGSVAADIAAQEISRTKNSPEIPAGFLQDFKLTYGDEAAGMLKDKVTLQARKD